MASDREALVFANAASPEAAVKPYDGIAQDIEHRTAMSRVLWLLGLGSIMRGPTAFERESYRAFHTSIDASMDHARAIAHSRAADLRAMPPVAAAYRVAPSGRDFRGVSTGG